MDIFPDVSLAGVEQIELKLSEVDRAILAAIRLDCAASDFLEHGADAFERREP